MEAPGCEVGLQISRMDAKGVAQAEGGYIAAVDEETGVGATDVQELGNFENAEEVDLHGAFLRILQDRSEGESKGLQEDKGSI